jgi:hypothetical protein
MLDFLTVAKKGRTQQRSEMDQDFKAFLFKKGITEVKYNGGSLDAQAKLVETIEKSKQGKTIIICLYSLFSPCLLSFPVYFHLVFLHVV